MRFLKRLVIGWVTVMAAAVVAAFTVKQSVPAYGGSEDDSFSLVAVVGGDDFVSTSDRFAEGNALALMGGIDIDLTGATLAPGAKLDLHAVMGGIEVTVPAHWRVEVIATERMGEVSVDRGSEEQPCEGSLLLVYAKATMGGISIRTPKAA